ncbi:MAG: dTMP kinase [Balneolaceae bacterium]
MLITFEGIDGSGKSTQIQRLASWLRKEDVTVRTLREPGGTGVSEKIRKLLLHHPEPMDSVTELLLFSAARSELVRQQVLPALERGEVVLLDRFYDSTLAYQGYGRKAASLQQIHALNELASHGCKPDLTVYLRLTPGQAVQRLKGEPDRMERSGDHFFERVVDGFDALALEEDRFRVVDAFRSVEEVEKEIRQLVAALLQG